MSKEEKEAIEYYKKFIDLISGWNGMDETLMIKNFKIILNLISTLQKKLDKKDKEIKKLKEDISNMYDEKVVRNILQDKQENNQCFDCDSRML